MKRKEIAFAIFDLHKIIKTPEVDQTLNNIKEIVTRGVIPRGQHPICDGCQMNVDPTAQIQLAELVISDNRLRKTDPYICPLVAAFKVLRPLQKPYGLGSNRTIYVDASRPLCTDNQLRSQGFVI